jgi:hypothetical protein
MDPGAFDKDGALAFRAQSHSPWQPATGTGKSLMIPNCQMLREHENGRGVQSEVGANKKRNLSNIIGQLSILIK